MRAVTYEASTAEHDVTPDIRPRSSPFLEENREAHEHDVSRFGSQYSNDNRIQVARTIEQTLAARGFEEPAQRLPHLDVIQRAFGSHDIRSVKAHVGGNATSAARALGAEAYAHGGRVVFSRRPSLHTAAHEAAHVVQQRNSLSAASLTGAASAVHERRADEIATAVVRGQDVERLLGPVRDSTQSHRTGSDAVIQKRREQSDVSTPEASDVIWMIQEISSLGGPSAEVLSGVLLGVWRGVEQNMVEGDKQLFVEMLQGYLAPTNMAGYYEGYLEGLATGFIEGIKNNLEAIAELGALAWRLIEELSTEDKLLLAAALSQGPVGMLLLGAGKLFEHRDDVAEFGSRFLAGASALGTTLEQQGLFQLGTTGGELIGSELSEWLRTRILYEEDYRWRGMEIGRILGMIALEVLLLVLAPEVYLAKAASSGASLFGRLALKLKNSSIWRTIETVVQSNPALKRLRSLFKHAPDRSAAATGGKLEGVNRGLTSVGKGRDAAWQAKAGDSAGPGTKRIDAEPKRKAPVDTDQGSVVRVEKPKAEKERFKEEPSPAGESARDTTVSPGRSAAATAGKLEKVERELATLDKRRAVAWKEREVGGARPRVKGIASDPDKQKLVESHQRLVQQVEELKAEKRRLKEELSLAGDSAGDKTVSSTGAAVQRAGVRGEARLRQALLDIFGPNKVFEQVKVHARVRRSGFPGEVLNESFTKSESYIIPDYVVEVDGRWIIFDSKGATKSKTKNQRVWLREIEKFGGVVGNEAVSPSGRRVLRVGEEIEKEFHLIGPDDYDWLYRKFRRTQGD